MIASMGISLLLVWWLVSPPPGVASCGPAGANANDTSSASRDPFAPALQKPDEARQVSPLEVYAVRDLRLVATVAGVDPPRALIEDPSGLGFVIGPGSIVGAERGTVVSIGGGRVVLEMSLRDPTRSRLILSLAGKSSRTEGP